MQTHEAGCLDEQVIAYICEQLTITGYCVVSDFLPELVINALYLEASSDVRLNFKQASIGREQLQQVNTSVRSDSIAWINGQSESQRLFLKLMENLRIEINRRLFMGLFDYESHYAHYGQGDFYKRHVDAFKGNSNRLLSSVVYLNADWVKADEGELLMFHDEQVSPFLIVEPIFNQCVIFLSEQFPHEVRAAKRDRYSIAGWFRTNNSIGGQIDPPR
ncbi:MAG: proline hydroxylase [Alteromonadaceae bacterium]|uniref:SM-20-related protein n=2 Tax=Paraglaciecola mesophila TaxID=197222 RepID=K6XQH8_9ALTE|nr:2OG-Fe(II) oxygenase [Paraglaciecola mesophila]MAD17068.1 proline hydroxylase [Alteromonadaceae bacterium]MBB20576.1 proline hydroxylase [Rickettsiales bacterium]GAC22874.1 SM-20-related protein [Paraglaciecola mesophila KMM 241]|tara:strand:+ start:9245 stop:9898 length:654 start_codon:yes stop_codon:yes gene_type:complete